MNLEEVRIRAVEFHARLQAVKKQLPVDFPWYAYDSLANIEHINQLLEGETRAVFSLIGEGHRVLDIGAADGDWSFFLEELGCEVAAIDHALTNANEMRGIRALKAHFGSKVEIRDTDIDTNFRLPDGKFELAFFLGILYHLKNPFYALEKLARQVKYLFVSTRVARISPSGIPLENDALAYLLGTHELNQDRSNYWIFSESALRRLVERAGWQVLAFRTFGSTESDPNSMERDERAFLLLRSKFEMSNVELLEGWHADEGNGWRWTAGRFSVAIPVEARRAKKIALEIYVPTVVLENGGPVTLTAEIGGVVLEPETFSCEGEFQYVRALPIGTTGQPLHFQLSRCLTAGTVDPRELGIIVASIQMHF